MRRAHRGGPREAVDEDGGLAGRAPRLELEGRGVVQPAQRLGAGLGPGDRALELGGPLGQQLRAGGELGRVDHRGLGPGLGAAPGQGGPHQGEP
ncbi:MAG: hypothetical protein ACK559_16710, partial [bacterium]